MTHVSATTNCWLRWPHASELQRTHFWFLSEAARVDASFLRHSRKRKSLFVNEDKSNATILHAITISLTATIWTILPEKRDHLTPHVWRNPVFPLGALCKHNIFLCSSRTQMLKKAEGITEISCTAWKSHGAWLKGTILLPYRGGESYVYAALSEQQT